MFESWFTKLYVGNSDVTISISIDTWTDLYKSHMNLKCYKHDLIQVVP